MTLKITPIPETEAEGSVLENYQKLKQSLELTKLPIFFTYFGPFPEYLERITVQLVKNSADSRFTELCQELLTQLVRELHNTFPKRDSLKEWISRFKHSPAYYSFEKDTLQLERVNAKLAYLFVGIREAIKGWGVAAHKLGSSSRPVPHASEEEFIAEDVKDWGSGIILQKDGLATSERSIEVSLLSRYLELCRLEYFSLIKSPELLSLRVRTESTILDTLPLLPHPLVSPINVVFKLIGNYPAYPDFLYLLSEHFPTYAMQRLMFSAYLLEP